MRGRTLKKLIVLAGAVALLVAAPAPATREDGHRRHQQGRLRAGRGVGPDRRLRDVDEQGHGRTIRSSARRARSRRRCSRRAQTLHLHVHEGGQVHDRRSAEQEQEGRPSRSRPLRRRDVSARPRVAELRQHRDGLPACSRPRGGPEGRHPRPAVRRERCEGRSRPSRRRPAAPSRTRPSRRSDTSYQARYRADRRRVTSSRGAGLVRPIVTLRRNALHRFTVQVVAAQSFVGKAVVFQRWVVAKHRWTTVKTVVLRQRARGLDAARAASTVEQRDVRSAARARLCGCAPSCRPGRPARATSPRAVSDDPQLSPIGAGPRDSPSDLPVSLTSPRRSAAGRRPS